MVSLCFYTAYSSGIDDQMRVHKYGGGSLLSVSRTQPNLSVAFRLLWLSWHCDLCYSFLLQYKNWAYLPRSGIFWHSKISFPIRNARFSAVVFSRSLNRASCIEYCRPKTGSRHNEWHSWMYRLNIIQKILILNSCSTLLECQIGYIVTIVFASPQIRKMADSR